jgi:hypothetical protein
MKKKLILFIWVIGLVFSTGFTPAYSVPDMASSDQALLSSTGNVQVLWSITNRSKSTAIFVIERAQPYFRTVAYVSGGTRVTRSITMSPGKYAAWVSFYDSRCKFIKKNIKVTKNTKRIAVSVTCGKF